MSVARSKKKKNKSRILLWFLVIALVVGSYGLLKVFGPNTGSMAAGEYVYIRTGSTYNDVKEALQQGGFIKDMTSFDLLAKRANYPAHVYAGKYHIEKGMSNYHIVRLLRSGRQTPVKLVINKLRTQDDFVQFVTTNLEADSQVMRQMFDDTVYLAQFGLDTNTVMCAVIPDTYEFFWNTSADKTFRKIAGYYKAYWTDERKQKAKNHGLTPKEAIIVASIVEEETNKQEDKGNIASVYINRKRINMPLQADPTVKFGLRDFSIRRITGVHLTTTSRYNTYKYAGLPPGPICTPSKKTIEAVLNAPDTKYLYFCAREDFSGYSRFAATLAEHAKNARLYQQALNARGIH
jgi:UPF0755 protein